MNRKKKEKDFIELKASIAQWSGRNTAIQYLVSVESLMKFILNASLDKQMQIQTEAETLMDKVEKYFKENDTE